MTRAFGATLAAAATSLACGGSPAAPSPPPVPTFSISGQVTDAAGAPLAGAKIFLSAGTNFGKTTTTDASGNYVLSGLQIPSGPELNGVFASDAPFYVPGGQNVTLGPGQPNLTLSFQLTRKSVTVVFDQFNTICSGPGVSFPGCAVPSPYTESGVTVSTMSGSWFLRSDYGSPAPYIEFMAPGGTTVTGELQVTAGGSTFTFSSVDLYASFTPIPYRITGLRNSAAVFTLSNTIPNTFGDFRTVTNPSATAVIDTLSIVMTNTMPASCCSPNQMGLDTIVLK